MKRHRSYRRLSNISSLSKLGLLATQFCITLLLVDRIHADQAPCATVSAGAETDDMTGSLQNVGQAAIGRADNGVVFMHAGGIACLASSTGVSCLLGDVNNDGFIDGLDIDPYTQVKISGMGTPQELCASNLDVEAFVALLLSQ